ncbi:MAG: sigma-54-dependent Fis family transcriptional regulator [Nitrospirae bacterium]|nr:MAG: sigma-54-dependent Fis family transcriptional regulator [Nitrospirota bacterium]
MEPEGTILVVDDDTVARDLLVEALRKEGYQVEAVVDGSQAIERGRQKRFDVVLTDIRMGSVDGLEVLREFKQISPDTLIVLLTAFGSMEGAIEAIKQGAYDYLAKPFKKEEIKLVVRRSLDHGRLVLENARFREELRERQELSPLVGCSPLMLEVYKLVARVSTGKSTVLLEGESGTGKELIARAIHANSPRRERLFVPVNCAALPDTLLETELFGHEKGAFTGAVGVKQGLFETAHEGSIFLDEIGELGLALQVKLLRVIQEQEVRRVGGTGSIKVDVRIIAATNRDLANLVKEGRFREDLFYRLNVVRIGLPPLRERREDIPVLAHHFFQKFSRGSTRPITGFVPGTLALLQRYHWPGNVRELENAIERAVSLSHGPLVLPDDLPEAIRNAGASSSEDRVGRGSGKEEALLTLDEVEKRHLMKVLRETGGNKARAAKILGIDRRTLYRMAERFGLEMGEGADESGLRTED